MSKEKQIGDYILEDEIGSGGFAKVVQGIHIPTGEKVAIKVLDKLQLMEDPDNLKRVEREIQILKLVKHKNIIELYEVMETPQKIYLVMELCEGGELFDYIVSKERLDENQSCHFFHEIHYNHILASLSLVDNFPKPRFLIWHTQVRALWLSYGAVPFLVYHNICRK